MQDVTKEKEKKKIKVDKELKKIKSGIKEQQCKSNSYLIYVKVKKAGKFSQIISRILL